MPALGFDEFIDIAHFSEADRCGQYVGDTAVADKVAELLASAAEPLFVFVITMENHGPLHLEQPDEALSDTVYRDAPQGPLHDLTVYLRHLRNADQMLARLTSALKATDRDGSLCWYGDHVPIMPAVYGHYGEPAASTPWLIWSSGAAPAREVQGRPGGQSLAAESLSEHWLNTVKACCRA
jgi:phosphoglycerol transferase MdoB-like AlkP superfamily enzyme